MQCAFGVQVYGEVFYLKFYSVFSEQFINDEIFLCKRLYCTTSCENAYDKGVVNFNSYMGNKFSI